MRTWVGWLVQLFGHTTSFFVPLSRLTSSCLYQLDRSALRHFTCCMRAEGGQRLVDFLGLGLEYLLITTPRVTSTHHGEWHSD